MDSQARDQGRCSLAAEALRSWGTLKVRAHGVSMLPTLWPGDVLTVQSVRPEEVEPGEIVLYMRRDRFFIHRIVSADLKRDKAFLVTRGDCMFEDDPPVDRSELLGRIVEVRRAGSKFHPGAKAFILSPAPGVVVLPLEPLPAGWIAIRGFATAKVTIRSTIHSLAQHSDRTEAWAISNPCHGAARK